MKSITNNPNDPFITQSILQDELDKRFREHTEMIVGAVNDIFQHLIDYMDKRFDAIDERFDTVDKRFAVQDEKFDRLFATTEVHTAQIARHEVLIDQLQPKPGQKKKSPTRTLPL